MIIMFIGNIGSGKTLSAVKFMIENQLRFETYTNIQTKKIKNVKVLYPDMIIKKEVTGYKTKRDGTQQELTKVVPNLQFWKEIKNPVNIIIDEAHTILNSRRSMSKSNIVFSDWLALIRRVLGSRGMASGNLILISQLTSRLDTIARNMTTQIRFHKSHWTKRCKKCGYTFSENSESPMPLLVCPKCEGFKFETISMKIEVWLFRNLEDYEAFKVAKRRTYFRHYFINNGTDYFNFYDTFQWDNLLTDL